MRGKGHNGLRLAVTLLTVIPWRAGDGTATAPPRATVAAAMAWAPAVGLLLGVIASAVLLVADHPLGSGPLTAAGLAIGSLALLTRGLHLDGLADLADGTAVFGLPEVTVGLVPGGGGTQLALRRLGPGRAADLVLTGRRVGIDEAERLGLVDRRVAAGQDGPAALELAGLIAANSPVAVRAAKRALRHGWGISLEAGLDVEDAAWRTAALSADRREGIAAFVEKRKPDWPGH